MQLAHNGNSLQTTILGSSCKVTGIMRKQPHTVSASRVLRDHHPVGQWAHALIEKAGRRGPFLEQAQPPSASPQLWQHD